MSRSIECGQCRQKFEPSEDLCGECLEAEQPAPEWLDAPDGPGWHWMRDPDGQLYIVHLYASADGLRTIHGSDPVYMRRQWQRVAPPRGGAE